MTRSPVAGSFPDSFDPGRQRRGRRLSVFYLAIACGLLGLLVALIAAVGVLGAYRWRAATRRIHAAMTAADTRKPPAFPDRQSRDRLPPPVQRYLNRVLGNCGRVIHQMRMRQTGTFNMSETGARWRPFSANQWVIVTAPAFDWDARIRAAPMVPVPVHDAYFSGEGLISATVLGLFPVVHIRNDGGAARGELMRFLAESPWYPTLLLPGGGVEWREIDDRSAEASLTEGRHTVRMTFSFGPDDLLSEVRAESRERLVSGGIEATPWRGRFRDYREHQGIWVPSAGEVAWALPEGEKPYWRGRLEAIHFAFAAENRNAEN